MQEAAETLRTTVREIVMLVDQQARLERKTGNKARFQIARSHHARMRHERNQGWSDPAMENWQRWMPTDQHSKNVFPWQYCWIRAADGHSQGTNVDWTLISHALGLELISENPSIAIARRRSTTGAFSRKGFVRQPHGPEMRGPTACCPPTWRVILDTEQALGKMKRWMYSSIL